MHYNRQSVPGVLLRLLSWGYGGLVALRHLLYHWGVLRVTRLPVPVISIGNLTTGGTGKTPVVMSLAQHLEAKGLKVAVLSRGYGAKIQTRFHEADHPDYGDEPYLLQQSLKRGKVFVGSKRAYTGEQACITFHPDVILLDDGFQHLPLYRDRNILLVDGARGFGNESLLPAGPLREDFSALNRVDTFLLTKTPTEKVQGRLEALLKGQGLLDKIPVYSCPFEPVALMLVDTQEEPLSGLKNHPVVLFSGIAQPQDFEAMIRDDLHAEVCAHLMYTDHQNYGAGHVAAIHQALQRIPQAWLITTEKDWVKLSTVLPEDLKPRVRVLKIAPVFDWETLLHGFLLERAPV